MTNECQVTKSRWRYTKHSNRVTILLDALGIEYRRAPEKSFWEANKEHLRYLYAELQAEARSKMRDLHPDTGGDAREFDAFIQSYNAAKTRFLSFITPVPAKPSPTLRFRIVKDQRRATQARARRQNNLENYRAYRRSLYRRQKDAGTLCVRKNKPKSSPETLARRERWQAAYRRANIDRVRQWRRNFYWRHRDRINAERRSKRTAPEQFLIAA